jgi:hypothetical protein
MDEIDSVGVTAPVSTHPPVKAAPGFTDVEDEIAFV